MAFSLISMSPSLRFFLFVVGLLLCSARLSDCSNTTHVYHHRSSYGYTSSHKPMYGNNRVSDDAPMGCKELRSKRYISDGLCTSVKPITEVVCSGHCLPVNELPWYNEYVKMWSHKKTGEEWSCVNDVVRLKRVYLLCENGERRAYRINVVRSCKCKKYKKPHNKTTRKRDKGVYDYKREE